MCSKPVVQVLMFKLTLPPDSPLFLRRFAVEAAAAAGFYSLSIEFPVLSIVDVPASPSSLFDVISIAVDESLPDGFSMLDTQAGIRLNIRDESGAGAALAELCQRLDSRQAIGAAAPGSPVEENLVPSATPRHHAGWLSTLLGDAWSRGSVRARILAQGQRFRLLA
jgi:hypothetical protein